MSGNSTVLVVNNDASTRSLLLSDLEQGGFLGLEASDVDTAMKVVQSRVPDAILIDPKFGSENIDGLELCRRFRTFTNTPIIFFTAHSDEVDQLLGLAVGADDYLTNPFSQRLLIARLSAVLRRSQDAVGPTRSEDILQRGDVRIDKGSRTVWVNSLPVSLTRIEFDLLVALAEKPQRVFTREQLVESVWGQWFGNDSHLDVHMSRLRKKILDLGGPRVGYAVRGFGFRYSL